MATSSRRFLSPSSFASFRSFLQSELASLRQSPILVIASEPANRDSLQTSVQQACRKVPFTLAQEFGLRTLPSTISSAVPSLHDVDQSLELLHRSGASSVVAVGSGAAMDLAKALRTEYKDIENLLLVPSTYAAVLASCTSHSLVLDPVEETLVSMEAANNPASNTTIAFLEETYFSTQPTDSSIVILAALALILDTGLRQPRHRALGDMIRTAQELLAAPTSPAHHDTMLELLQQSASPISYGHDHEVRSTPIALVASLVPPLFPQVHVLSFWAMLVPGLCCVLQDEMGGGEDESKHNLIALVRQIQTSAWLQASIPALAELEESKQGFSVPDMALSHIQSNQALWKSLDVPTQQLIDILQYSWDRT